MPADPTRQPTSEPDRLEAATDKAIALAAATLELQ
jgi:hypothetical protein